MTDRLTDIRRYRAELDQVLLTGSIEQFKRFAIAHNVPHGRTDDVVEITMHKTITASLTLPRDYRRKSKAWLTARGYHGLDDGDL